MRLQHVRKRQTSDGSQSAEVSLSPDGETLSISIGAAPSSFVGASVTGAIVSFSAPPIAGSAHPIVTVTSTPSPSITPAASAVPQDAAASSSSQISVGAVIGACVGAFAGAAFLIGLLIFYCRRDAKQRKALATAAIQRGQAGRGWQKTDEDTWEGKSGATVARRDTMTTEKAFGMFKKTPSIYSSKTGSHGHSSEETGFSLPPLEFSKYHPGLAAELAQPPRPFADRQESTSWDGSTVADDSFLSMRSVRVDTGTMSPTITMAKATPPASASPIHRWESAEVLQIEESNAAGPDEVNPFADPYADPRRSVGNPFFNARDMRTLGRARSRSASGSTSRRVSRARSASDAPTRASTIRESVHDPFRDIEELPIMQVDPVPTLREQHDSVASGYSAAAFGEHAMRSLIAALDLTEEQVADRLRAAEQDSVRLSSISGYSHMTGMTSTSVGDDDVATMRNFPMPPSSHSSGSGHSPV